MRVQCTVPLIFFVGATLFWGCRKSPSVMLRKFPYPYRAALAISSDCDQTDPKEFLTLMKYLNTPDSTPIGKGVGLEVGYSFWFYDPLEQSSLTIFKDTTDTLTPFEPMMRTLIQAGYLDYLHTFGEFSLGGFSRKLAIKAYKYLQTHNLRISVWVNHGPPTNSQNLGNLPEQRGDNPESSEYHTDLLLASGVRFIGKYDVVHTVGQDGQVTIWDRLKQLGEAFKYLVLRREWMFGRLLGNHLIDPWTLDDGRQVYVFKRFISSNGKVDHPNARSLAQQIPPEVIRELERKGGFMILYTHLGDNSGPPSYFSSQTKEVFQYLAKEFHEGRLLVTTTSRLLRYNLLYRYLDWTAETAGETLKIVIHGVKDPVQGYWVPTERDLGGITFYIPRSHGPVQLMIRTQPLQHLRENPPDAKGLPSVSIPWPFLQFPRALTTIP